MKYVKQLCLLLFIAFVGELLSHFVPFPIPASIYGIVILFVCLVFGIIPLKAVKETGDFLVAIMPIMFIPAAAGLIDSWAIIRNSWIQYFMIAVVSTVIVMGVSGRVTQWIVRKGKNKNA